MKWQPEIIWLHSHARIITCKLDCQMLKTCKCFTLNFLLVLIKPRRNVLKIMSILFPFWREGIKLYAQWFLLQMHLLQCTRVIQQNSYCILSKNECITRWTWYGIGETRKRILWVLKCTEVQYGDDRDVQLKRGVFKCESCNTWCLQRNEFQQSLLIVKKSYGHTCFAIIIIKASLFLFFIFDDKSPITISRTF